MKLVGWPELTDRSSWDSPTRQIHQMIRLIVANFGASLFPICFHSSLFIPMRSIIFFDPKWTGDINRNAHVGSKKHSLCYTNLLVSYYIGISSVSLAHCKFQLIFRKSLMFSQFSFSLSNRSTETPIPPAVFCQALVFIDSNFLSVDLYSRLNWI